MGKMAPDKTNTSVQTSKEEKEVLRQLAKESGMTLSAYLRELIEPAIRDKIIYERRMRRNRLHDDAKTEQPKRK